MTAADLLRGAFVEIRAHKVRSALTCVSLTVGVAAALFTLNMSASSNKRYADAMRLAGPGRLVIQPKQGYVKRGLSKGLTAADAAAIRERFPELYMVNPVARSYSASFTHKTLREGHMWTLGVTDEWQRREWVFRKEGRFLNSRDVAEAARVTVLIMPGGFIKRPPWARWFRQTKYERYLKKVDVLGQYVNINQRPFKVVGILYEPPRDNDPRWFTRDRGRPMALVPISAFSRYVGGRRGGVPDAVDEIRIDTGDEATAGRYTAEIRRLLLARHRGEQDFEVKDFREIAAGALESIKKFVRSVAAIGIVAMLAGGIGILNVTLATVFSRVREIGVRRALGAERRDIVAQFVTEALLLGFIAGVIGSALGSAGVLLFSPNERTIAAFSPVYAVISTGIAVGVAFLFSAVPAWRASLMDPVESLRYE